MMSRYGMPLDEQSIAEQLVILVHEVSCIHMQVACPVLLHPDP